MGPDAFFDWQDMGVHVAPVVRSKWYVMQDRLHRLRPREVPVQGHLDVSDRALTDPSGGRPVTRPMSGFEGSCR